MKSELVRLLNHEPFVNALSRIEAASKHILAATRKKELKVEEGRVEEMPMDPEQVMEMLLELLRKCANTTINASEFTFTAWKLWGLTLDYLEQVHLGEFDFLKNLLGLEPVFKPDIWPSEAQERYTVYSYPEFSSYYTEIKKDRGPAVIPGLKMLFQIPRLPLPRYCCYKGQVQCHNCTSPICLEVSSVGAGLCALNFVPWELFEADCYKLNSILENPPRLKSEYREKVKEKLSEFSKPKVFGEGKSDMDRFEITITGQPEFELRAPLVTKKLSYIGEIIGEEKLERYQGKGEVLARERKADQPGFLVLCPPFQSRREP